MALRLEGLRATWSASPAVADSTLHQLAPYIGKLKVPIARTLISAFSRPGDIILDPFSGSGVVPLESLLLGRGVIANDFNPYAAVLSKAKLFPISNVEAAVSTALEFVARARKIARRQRYQVDAPVWVRRFYHQRTLAETKILAELLIADRQWFLLANLLGILHHQRPGFLSYPSSHLVPYLRVKRFPRRRFPDLYRYRDVGPRLARKIRRSYRRFAGFPGRPLRIFSERPVANLRVSREVDLVVTSPPYMNALDYGRDNRLRLWFIGVEDFDALDRRSSRNPCEFANLIGELVRVIQRAVRPRGLAALIVGEVRNRDSAVNTSRIVRGVFAARAPGWRLIEQIEDEVPDIRRSRRECACTKREWIMIFRRSR